METKDIVYKSGDKTLTGYLADGSNGTPTLFDSPDADVDLPGIRWKLDSIERRSDDIIWLRYSAP